MIPVRCSTYPLTSPRATISNQFVYEFGPHSNTPQPAFTIDPNAEILDIPDGITSPIQPHALDHLFNLCSIRWGRHMQPIPIDVIPDRFLTLMLPFEYRAHIGLSRLSPKVWIFIHVSNIHLGPTDRPFFVWKEGDEPFAFASQPGITFRGEYGPRRAITYLKAYMPIKGYLIPNCSTPCLATLKHKITTKNSMITNSLCKRTLEQITEIEGLSSISIESPTKRRVIDTRPAKLETGGCFSPYDPTIMTNEGRDVVSAVIEFFHIGRSLRSEYVHYPRQPEYLGELVVFLRRYLPSHIVQIRWEPRSDTNGPIQCIIITAKTSSC